VVRQRWGNGRKKGRGDIFERTHTRTERQHTENENRPKEARNSEEKSPLSLKKLVRKNHGGHGKNLKKKVWQRGWGFWLVVKAHFGGNL